MPHKLISRNVLRLLLQGLPLAWSDQRAAFGVSQ
jgi:hypothetical protein